MTATATPYQRRASSPTIAPTRTTTATTVTVSAVLSLVPNSDTMKSLEPGGAKSMTADPTAAIGEGTPASSPANSSPAASATSAATMPASAASPRGATGATVGAAIDSVGAGANARVGWLMRAVSATQVTVA